MKIKETFVLNFKRIIIPTLILTYCSSVSATIIRDSNGDLIRPGDSVQRLYKLWGKPTLKTKSEESCNRIEVKTVCSKSRLIWKRDGRYFLIQYKKGTIIKTGWTRRESAIKEEI